MLNVRQRHLCRVLSTLTSLSKGGIDLTTRIGRFRAQKGVYFLAALGHRPANSYAFSLYLHGPYSPSLSRDYYAIVAEHPTAVADLKERFEGLSRIPAKWEGVIRDAYAHGDDFLEAAATLHAVRAANPTASTRTVIAHVARMKPHLMGILQGAMAFLRHHALVK